MKYQLVHHKTGPIAEFMTLEDAHMFAEVYSYAKNGNAIYGLYQLSIDHIAKPEDDDKED